MKPARCSAGQKRLPGRAKWNPVSPERSDGLMPQKRTCRPGPTTSGTGFSPRGEVLRVDLRVARPLGRQLVLGEARVHGAGLDAGVAVDALLGIDVQLVDLVVVGLVRRRVDAVDGAHLDARVVLGPDAGLRDHVGHGRSSTPIRLGASDCTRPLGGGRAASSWAASASSGPSPAGRPMSWTPSGSPPGWAAERERDRRGAGDVGDRRERREGGAAGERRRWIGAAGIDRRRSARAPRRATGQRIAS